jgi:prolyl oligopeptidase
MALLGALTAAQAQPALPATPKRPVSDTYFGKTVVDNYRWLEDMNSPEVQDWFKSQSDFTTPRSLRFRGATSSFRPSSITTNC